MPVIQLPYNNWKVRPYQQPFWDAWQKHDVRRLIEIAHRRWGKDDVCLHGACIKAHERPANYWHAFPEYAQARKGIWTAINPHTGKRRIDEAFPMELRESTNESEMLIKLKVGSTWQVIGSDRYNSLVGAGVAGVVFSEFALANPSAWAYLRPMLEENDGWAAFITTPRGRNHAKSMFDMAQQNPKWFAEISTVHNTGALSPDQLQESLAEYTALYGSDLGRAQFEQEYLCSFNAAILGAFYAREMLDVRNEGRITPIEPLEGKPVHRAWDIGVKDDTSIWWFQVVGLQVLILDCYSSSGAGVDHYAEQIERRRETLGWMDGIDYVPHDAAHRIFGLPGAKTTIDQMVQFGLHPELVPSLSKLDGINAARKTLARCVFDPRCEEFGISALEQYRREWDDDKKTFRANEVHDWASHPADAFRYLSIAWRSAPRETEQPKARQQSGTVLLDGPPKPRKRSAMKV
jgi:phage terminase large subunit